MKTTKLFALTLAAALALPSHEPAQARQQGPIFGTGIEIINLSLSVTDARNNFVTDLVQKDFAVFEDGIRQDLSLFTHENLPISMVLMIDTSASMEEKLKTAQDAAIRFTKTLRQQDLAQVVQFNERATPLLPDRRAIHGEFPRIHRPPDAMHLLPREFRRLQIREHLDGLLRDVLRLRRFGNARTGHEFLQAGDHGIQVLLDGLFIGGRTGLAVALDQLVHFIGELQRFHQPSVFEFVRFVDGFDLFPNDG